jgi:hypothetical protein
MHTIESDGGLFLCGGCGALLWTSQEITEKTCAACWEEHELYHCMNCGAVASEFEGIAPFCQVCENRWQEENTRYLAECRDAMRN